MICSKQLAILWRTPRGYHILNLSPKSQFRNFEIIGEAAKNLPPDLKTRYPSVAWKQVAGLRDVIAHGYFHIDYEILWGIITNTLPKFKTEVTKIRKTEQQKEKEFRK